MDGGSGYHLLDPQRVSGTVRARSQAWPRPAARTQSSPCHKGEPKLGCPQRHRDGSATARADPENGLVWVVPR